MDFDLQIANFKSQITTSPVRLARTLSSPAHFPGTGFCLCFESHSPHPPGNAQTGPCNTFFQRDISRTEFAHIPHRPRPDNRSREGNTVELMEKTRQGLSRLLAVSILSTALAGCANSSSPNSPAPASPDASQKDPTKNPSGTSSPGASGTVGSAGGASSPLSPNLSAKDPTKAAVRCWRSPPARTRRSSAGLQGRHAYAGGESALLQIKPNLRSQTGQDSGRRQPRAGHGPRRRLQPRQTRRWLRRIRKHRST